MEDKEIFFKLKNYFGLNLYEIKIWIELLRLGVSGVGELSKKSNVPRSRTYDTLESLKKKGFVLLKMDKPLKYISISPNDVIDILKENTLKKAKEKINFFESIKNNPEIIKLNNIYNKSKESTKNVELNGIINGRINIHNYMKNLIKKSNSTIFLSMEVDDITRRIKDLKKELEFAKKRGVMIRILTNSNNAQFLKNIGSLININKNMNISKFLISDNKDILFLLGNNLYNKYDKAIWIKDELFVNGLNNIFNHILDR